MLVSIAQRLDSWARNFSPAITAILFAILEVVPTGIPGFENVTPAFAMMAVFYWSLYRPDLVPVTAVFAVGLLLDILSGGPIGINALIMLGVYGVVLTQRPAFLGKPFFVAWLGFVVIAGVAVFLHWLLSCLLALQLLPIGKAIGQFVLTAVVFPLVAWMLVRVHRLWVR
jgi:rod shape-determining protein MreD